MYPPSLSSSRSGLETEERENGGAVFISIRACSTAFFVVLYERMLRIIKTPPSTSHVGDTVFSKTPKIVPIRMVGSSSTTKSTSMR